MHHHSPMLIELHISNQHAISQFTIGDKHLMRNTKYTHDKAYVYQLLVSGIQYDIRLISKNLKDMMFTQEESMFTTRRL